MQEVKSKSEGGKKKKGRNSKLFPIHRPVPVVELYDTVS